MISILLFIFSFAVSFSVAAIVFLAKKIRKMEHDIEFLIYEKDRLEDRINNLPNLLSNMFEKYVADLRNGDAFIRIVKREKNDE